MPLTKLAHSLLKRHCRSVDAFLLLFRIGSPRLTRSISVSPIVMSFCKFSITVHSEGFACPIKQAKALFHPSQMLFVRACPPIVASCTFQTSRGNLGGTRRILKGTTSLALPCPRTRRNPPDTYVASK